MKFTWFNLMPWPHLPDDFREKNRSVWVDIDSRLFEPVRAHEVYNTYMDMLEYAGRLGFDGIGAFCAPAVVEAEARRTFDVQVVGRLRGVRERFYALSAERKLRHPAVLAIADSARRRLATRRRGTAR